MIHSKKLFWVLWLLCVVGGWSVLPYTYSLGMIPPGVSLWRLFLIISLESALIFGFLCWGSYKLLPKTDLQPFTIKNPAKQIVYPALIAGISVGVILFFLERTVFQGSYLSRVHAPWWTGLFASLYGGVNEEVTMRLFLFTAIYYIFRKIFKFSDRNRTCFLWTVNVIVALLFGLGHLPMALKMASFSSLEFVRIFLLNGIAGFVFGWLYWSRGLWTAMAAHFITDLMIHVFLI